MLSVSVLLPLLAAAASSLDCAAAKDSATRLVCSDAELSALEHQLSGLYSLTQRDGETAAAQQTRQTAWLQDRARCAESTNARDCIAGQYKKRIVELKITLHQVPVFASASYLCPGRGSTALLAAYYQTDPAAVRVTYDGQQALAFAAPAASGARYTEAGIEIWEHQGQALFSWHGAQMICSRQ